MDDKSNLDDSANNNYSEPEIKDSIPLLNLYA